LIFLWLPLPPKILFQLGGFLLSPLNQLLEACPFLRVRIQQALEAVLIHTSAIAGIGGTHCAAAFPVTKKSHLSKNRPRADITNHLVAQHDLNRAPVQEIHLVPFFTLLNDILAGKEQVNFQHGTQLVQKLLGASLEEFRAAQHAVILNDGPGVHLVGR